MTAILWCDAWMMPRLHRAEWLAEWRPELRAGPRAETRVVPAGRATLEASQKRYPLLAKLIPGRQEDPA